MPTITLYNPQTGDLGPVLSVEGDVYDELIANTPFYLEGEFDIRSKRLDPITKELVDKAPPKPYLQEIRRRRDNLLDAYRWTVGPDSPLSAENRAVWLEWLKGIQTVTDGLTPETTDQVVWPPLPPFIYSDGRGAPDLDTAREAVYAKIDEEAEKVRNHFITTGSGQAITYMRKEAEAAAYMANPNAPTPILSAEANAVGVTVQDLAQEIITAAQLWLVVGSMIEATRRGAKKAVADATTLEEISQAGNVDWSPILNAA